MTHVRTPTSHADFLENFYDIFEVRRLTGVPRPDLEPHPFPRSTIDGNTWLRVEIHAWLESQAK